VSKINAIIVDDEESARNVLSSLLTRCCPEINVVAKCVDVPEAVEHIKRLNPDVVFLDVQMPNYAGYEIANFFDDITFEIIFVTAFDQYAIKAFELSAIDYLVKPINRLRLAEAINRLKDKVEQKSTKENYEVLLESIKQKEFEKIIIPELGNKRVLLLKNIIAIEAKGAYSNVYLMDNKNVLVSKNLKYFETVLPENSTFFRAHKSWVINLRHMETYSNSKHQITLGGNIVAKLSKYRLTEFEAELAALL
jgi:two-component system LytT family response regulator